MSNICKSLKELSLQGHWDVVFSCLNLDSNTTIELANLKSKLRTIFFIF